MHWPFGVVRLPILPCGPEERGRRIDSMITLYRLSPTFPLLITGLSLAIFLPYEVYCMYSTHSGHSEAEGGVFD